MKKNIYLFGLISLLFLLSNCTLDYENPNAATEDQLNNSNALMALAIGIQQQYSVKALDNIIFAPSLSTRETSLILTNVANQELEKGGTALLGNNLRIINLFSSIAKVKGMTETLLKTIPETTAVAGTKSGLKAWGNLFRALCLGAMSQSWEAVPLLNSTNNDAAYVARENALLEAITLLEEALTILEDTPSSDEFKSIVSKNISLTNTINAYLSRYHLMMGNYEKSITTANAIDINSTSVFDYDDQNQNPVYVGMLRAGELLFYAPRENFGLPAVLIPEAEDQRIAFYLTNNTNTSLTGFPVKNGTNSPFFSTPTSGIPVYLPGELTLNKAEAYTRLGMNTEAVEEIDKIRTKKASEDAFGLGANLTAYSGALTTTAILDEIYKNRRIELFLTGLSLEDSRRFNREGPTSDGNFLTERSRNFYPYPSTERVNNPNTPNNPIL